MLLDMLGILIGFVAVILLVSILVTGIVQTVSSFGRLRHRALVRGIDEAGLRSLGDDLKVKLESRAQPLARAKVQGEYRVEDSEQSVAYGAASQIASNIKNSVDRACNDKRITWLDPKQIVEPLRAAGAHASVVISAEQQFERAKDIMEYKFLQWTRVTTFVVALVVAGLFQISAPDLLERLQEDNEFRLRAAATGEQLSGEPAGEYEGFLYGPELAARTNFLKLHPKYTTQLGELTFEARSVDDLVADFETAMDAEENRDALAAEYRLLVENELADPDAAVAMAAARRSVNDLGALDIQVLADKNFFMDPQHIVGILFTAILLSLGAPFWFNVLKELVGLKDALRKKASTLADPEKDKNEPKK